MSAPTKLRLKQGEARWSSACKCPRMAVYAMRGVEPAPTPLPMQLRMERGKLDAEWLAQRFDLQYPGEVEREREIEWPGGTLHGDIFIRSEQTIFEVKSTTSPASMLDDAIIQNAGQQHWDPEAKQGGVILIEPSTLSHKIRPVILNPALVETVENIAAQVVKAGKKGPLPDRVCEHPRDAMSKMCPFASHCFADEPAYEPPKPINVDGEIATLAAELYHAKREEHARAGAVAEATTKRKQLQAALRELVEPNLDYNAGGIKLKRSVFEKTTYSDINKGIAAGDLDPDKLAPYRTVREEERWNVETTSEFIDGARRVDPDSFGEEPPF